MSEKTNESEAKKDSKPWFSIILNYVALLILLTIIYVFANSALMFTNKEPSVSKPLKTSINFTLDQIQLKKSDTTLIKINKQFIDSLNVKIVELKEQAKSINKTKEYLDYLQDRNENDFRLLLIILGSVFAIVGFFGFKSINDTRQNAIEKAVFDAKEVAKADSKKRIDDELSHIEKSVEGIIKNGQLETKLQMRSDIDDFIKRLDALSANYNELKDQVSIAEKIDSKYNDILIRLKDLEKLKGHVIQNNDSNSTVNENSNASDEQKELDELDEKDEFA
jgi:hypothetical protein